MTEIEAIKILEVVRSAIDARSEAFKIAIDALKREDSRDEKKASEYRCPRCGLDAEGICGAEDEYLGIVYCPQCDEFYREIADE